MYEQNYTYGSFKYIPVGTICTLKNCADTTYNNLDVCIIAEPCMTKSDTGKNVMAYPTNIVTNGVRKAFERECLVIKQYPLAEEMWLNRVMADLTKPLYLFPDAVKFNL